MGTSKPAYIAEKWTVKRAKGSARAILGRALRAGHYVTVGYVRGTIDARGFPVSVPVGANPCAVPCWYQVLLYNESGRYRVEYCQSAVMR